MTGRVLLVCALCVLWCGAVAAVSAADGAADATVDPEKTVIEGDSNALLSSLLGQASPDSGTAVLLGTLQQQKGAATEKARELTSPSSLIETPENASGLPRASPESEENREATPGGPKEDPKDAKGSRRGQESETHPELGQTSPSSGGSRATGDLGVASAQEESLKRTGPPQAGGSKGRDPSQTPPVSGKQEPPGPPEPAATVEEPVTQAAEDPPPHGAQGSDGRQHVPGPGNAQNTAEHAMGSATTPLKEAAQKTQEDDDEAAAGEDEAEEEKPATPEDAAQQPPTRSQKQTSQSSSPHGNSAPTRQEEGPTTQEIPPPPQSSDTGPTAEEGQRGGTALPDESDSGTAVPHSTSPLLLLLVACAAAMVAALE